MSYEFDKQDFDRDYNIKPFVFAHDLHTQDLFSPDRLTALSRIYDRHQDSFVAGSARTPGTIFRSVESGQFGTYEAMQRMDEFPLRILLKRLENHDPDFRALRDRLYSQIVDMRPELKDQKLTRLETSVFVSSGATTTPFHFDPEVNFFTQIEGEKEYHVYEPASVTTQELEDFYARQVVDIAQIPLAGRPANFEHVFALKPGMGFHQPVNAPHWVRTGTGRSVSYSLIIETEAMRALGRVRACNHYMRKIGLSPRPAVGNEAMKAALVAAALPIKREIGKIYRVVKKRPEIQATA